MIGDETRPPCVVHMPNSSASERSQSSLPSRDSDISRPLPLKAKTLPLAGSTTGDAQAMRCGGTSLVKMLYLYSQSSLPGVGVEAHQAFLHQLRLRPRCSAGRGDRQRSPVRSVRRTGPSRPGSGPRATTRTAGRFRSRRRCAPGRASRASRRRAGAPPRGSATQWQRASGRRGSVDFHISPRIAADGVGDTQP